MRSLLSKPFAARDIKLIIDLIKRIYKSFSFRLAFVCMSVFLCSLIFLRMLIYYGIVNEAVGDVKTIIEQQIRNLDDALKDEGVDYTLNLISIMLSNDHEKTMAIIFLSAKETKLEGNLESWPELKPDGEKWFTFSVNLDPDSPEESHYLAAVKTYPSGSKLLVGYNLKHVENIRKIISNVLWQNILLSLVAAVVSSTIITFLISRRLRVFNNSFARVMEGNLEHSAGLSGSNDEFDRLAQHFNAMLAWINRLVTSTKETADNLAHDMRTPLNRHRIRLEGILQSPGVNNKTVEAISEAINDIDRIVEMFDAILNISKAEAKSNIANFEEFDATSMVKRVLDFYRELADDKFIRITSEMPEKIYFKGDSQLFAQAIANLLDNAIKYTPERGKIQVELQDSADKFILSIADSGAGIPPEYYEKVKERFFRMDKSRTTAGTGLGLSLVDAVVRMHGGFMEFSDNNPGLKVTLIFKR